MPCVVGKVVPPGLLREGGSDGKDREGDESDGRFKPSFRGLARYARRQAFGRFGRSELIPYQGSYAA